VCFLSQKAIEKSLTSLTTERLQLEAVEIFKGIQLFAGAVINQTALDYHISLAQGITSKGLKEPEIQNEVVLQLIKQTTKSPYPNSAMSIQAWQLLAIVLGVFLPTKLVSHYLLLHLSRTAKKAAGTSVGKYASYCLSLVEQQTTGKRSLQVSRHEIVSVFQIEDSMELTTKIINLDFNLINKDIISVSFTVGTLAEGLLGKGRLCFFCGCESLTSCFPSQRTSEHRSTWT